jgi:hypothetical protein
MQEPVTLMTQDVVNEQYFDIEMISKPMLKLKLEGRKVLMHLENRWNHRTTTEYHPLKTSTGKVYSQLWL